MKFLVKCILIFCLAQATVFAKTIEEMMQSSWAISVSKAKPVAYAGLLSRDSYGGGTASVMYTGPGFAGFAASLMTHGAINNSQRKAEEARIQADADRIFEPFRENLKSFTYENLFIEAQKILMKKDDLLFVDSQEKSTAQWLFAIEPNILMSQDQRALILEGNIAIYAANNLKNPFFQNNVRAVSRSIVAEKTQEFWEAEKGRNIKEISATLLADTLRMVLFEIQNTVLAVPSKNQKTIRYFVGDNLKVVRAELRCVSLKHAVVKNLSGELMWLPLKEDNEYFDPKQHPECI